MTSVTTPDSREIQYTYDGIGNTASVTYNDGATRSYEYANTKFPHLLTKLTDAAGNVSVFSYDSLGRVTQNTLPTGSVEKFSYATDGATYTDAAGKAEAMKFAIFGGVLRPTSTTTSCAGCATTSSSRTFDGNGNLLSFKSPAGYVTAYTYDPVSNLEISRTEALRADGTNSPATRTIATSWDLSLRKPVRIVHTAVGEPDWVETMEYDGRGNLTASEESSGQLSRRTSYTFDANSHVTSIDGPRTDVSDVTKMTYFADDDPCTGCRGQLKTITNALGHVTRYEAYDANGNLLQVRDANGAVSLNAYDDSGHLISVTAAAGTEQAEVTTYKYDSAGKVTETESADGLKATYTYDADGEVSTVQDRDGSTLRYVRNASGYVTGRNLYDPNGVLRKKDGGTIDPQGRLAASIDAYGQRTTFDYDAESNRISTITPLGALSQNEFDGLNRVVSTSQPSGGVIQVSYNSRDQISAYSDANGHVTTYGYDGLGNLVAVTSLDSGAATYKYDAAGNMIESTDARGIRSTYAYDALDRIVGRIDGAERGDAISTVWTYDTSINGIGRPASIVSGATQVLYDYDLLGRVTVDSQKDSSGTERKVGYRYFQGHLVVMTYPSGMVATYGYDSSGRVNDVAVDGVKVMTNTVYGPFGRLEYYEAAPGQGVRRTYDLNGRLIEATLGPATAIAGSYSYQYDADRRIIHAVTPDEGFFDYAYDFNGNRVSSRHNGVQSIYGYDLSSNRLASVGFPDSSAAESFGYDLAGNVTRRDGWSYTYDNAGKLVSAQGGDSVTYSTDGLGRRISANAGPDRTTYLYGTADRFLGHYGTKANDSYETVFVAGLPVALVSHGGEASMEPFIAYTDQIGTIRSIADRQGAVVWAWGGEPFGSIEPTAPDGSHRLEYSGRFPGQYVDRATGLFYNLNRDYAPMLGRYLQSDPAGLVGGPNTYAYVGGDPETRSDPDGRSWLAAFPHDDINPTIECDGKGGVRIFIGKLFDSKELACIEDCVVAHEKVHLEDAIVDSPCYLKDAGLQVYNPSLSITYGSEVRAYKKSLSCLRAKLVAEKSKQCPACESYLKTNIDRQEKMLKSYQSYSQSRHAKP